MKIGIICKVIDNYGDAGFSLRLGRALAAQNHDIVLFHDNTEVMNKLLSDENGTRLQLIDTQTTNWRVHTHCEFDLLIEPFGTSSEHTLNRFDLDLKKQQAITPWLLIDYLSSESWVDDFHLTTSVNPNTGHVTTYFYPGFTQRTGGVIHCDYPKGLRETEREPFKTPSKIFVFSYPQAPLQALIAAENAKPVESRVEIHVAGQAQQKPPETRQTALRYLPFCPQTRFDALLHEYDVLFVRGEDSFVRAQLAGRPLIWQIYPTEDGLHGVKLQRFFEKYTDGLSASCKTTFWNCWQSWNSLMPDERFGLTWLELQNHWPELCENAIAWRNQLFDNPDLVSEVLTWRAAQTPTLIDKPDL